MTVDVFLYHFQGIIYTFFWCFFACRFVVNWLVHMKTDSYIYNLEEFEGYGHWGDSNRRYSSQANEQLFLIAFTFWWDMRPEEPTNLKSLKKFANILNVGFLILAVEMLVFFLHMQEVNHTYHFMKQNPWQYLDNK